MSLSFELTGVLVNFHSEYVPVQLITKWTGSLAIERDAPVDDLDLHLYMDPIAHHDLTDGSDFVPYAIVYRSTIANPSFAKADAQAVLRETLSAIRLIKSMWIAMPLSWVRLFDEAGSVLFSHVSVDGWELAQSRLGEDSSPSIFGQRDLAALQLVADCISAYPDKASGDDARRMRIAIERFNYAIDRVRPEDKLLDLAIALEALFVVRADYDAGSRISDQIAQRCCLYLESLRHDHALLSEVKAWYRVRSTIVHGGDPGDDLTAAIGGLGQLTRRTIKKELLEPGSLARLRAL